MDLKVNDAEWKALGKDEQLRIEAIVTGFFKNAKIVPDSATAKTAQTAASTSLSLCEIACNVAEHAAKAACLSLGNPIAIAACIAVAEEAGKACRDAC